MPCLAGRALAVGASAGVNPFAGGTPTGVGLPGGEFGMTNLNMSGYGQLGARF
jgi:hypothetical protein